MTAHTKTPWTLGQSNTEITAFDGFADNPVEAALIATTGTKWLSPQRNQANAAHIVRCVNQFPLLLEALQKIATPALGGKQQQWIAQKALKALAGIDLKEAP